MMLNPRNPYSIVTCKVLRDLRERYEPWDLNHLKGGIQRSDEILSQLADWKREYDLHLECGESSQSTSDSFPPRRATFTLSL